MVINDQYKRLDKKKKRMFLAAASMEIEVTLIALQRKLTLDDFKEYERVILQNILDKINNGVQVKLVYVNED